MKQMPVESRFACVGRPASRAIARTSRLTRSPSGNSDRGQLFLRQPVQEVALVLRRVRRLEQPHAVRVRARARVVARRDPVGAERERVVEERAELDLAVAQHVRVRRAAGGVLAQEVREHALAVLGGEVHGGELDAEDVGDRRGVDEVLARRAVEIGVVVLPVLHEHADDLVPRALEEQRGDRRIDAAGQADDDAMAGRVHGAFSARPGPAPAPTTSRTSAAG